MSDAIVRLRIENQEYDAKLKRATDGLQRYVEGCRKAGGTLEVVEKETLDFVKALGQMDTTSKSATGKLNEMKKAFTEWSVIYKEMTAEEKKGEFGKALSSGLDELKARINDSKKELADIEKELNGATHATGDFSGVLGQLGSKLGINADLLGAVTTGTVGYVAAAGAAITATIAATKAWADYNMELSKQQQIVNVTTGLDGSDANKLRDAAKSISDVYGTDFREVINAANVLMTQFGQTIDQSIQLLRDGMQGMIAGDGPKMLNMIQQFAPAFRDAGISADQLIAIIHNSEGGLFSEQNMNAILMGIKNIRLMTKSTSDALAQLGLDGEEMSKRMSEGSMTVFEALNQVAEAIEGAKAGSQEAGQVMQQVFGRQGAMQGMKLGRAIAELNTNLAETKRQTGELGKSFAALEMANEMLNESIRNATGWQDMEQSVKNVEAVFVGAVAAVVGAIGDVRNALYDLTGIDVFDSMAGAALNALGPVGTLLDKLRQIAGINITPPDDSTKYNRNDFKNPIGGVINKVAPTSTYEDRPKPEQNQQTTILNQERRAAEEDAKAIEKLNERLEALKKLRAEAKDAQTRNYYKRQIADVQTKLNAYKGITTTPKTSKVDTKKEVELVSGSIAEQTKLVQDLQKAWQNTADDESRKKIKADIEQAQTVLDVMNGKTALSDITITVNDAEALEHIKNIEGIVLDPKTLTVDAETGEAVEALNAVEGITLDPKNVTVTAYTSEALAKLQDIQGIKIEPIDVEGLKALAAAEKQYADAVKNTPTFEGFKGGVAESMRQTGLKVDTNTLTTMMQVAIQNGIDGLDVDFEHLWRQMGTVNIDDSTWQNIQDQINEKLAELHIEPIQIDFKTGNLKTVVKDAKKADDGFKDAMQSVQNLGSALNNLEDPGAKIAGTVGQAIAQIALGFAQATATTGGTSGIFGWIAAITGGLATMTATISAIHSATGYAEGGLVKGPGGVDNVPAWLTAGEIVLNHAQQQNVAQAIMSGNDGGGESGGGIPYVTGETIVLGMNNHLKRSGQGEIVTTGMLKRMKLI